MLDIEPVSNPQMNPPTAATRLYTCTDFLNGIIASCNSSGVKKAA